MSNRINRDTFQLTMVVRHRNTSGLNQWQM